MATYKAPLNEISFVLNEVLDVSRLSREIPEFEEATPDLLLGLAEEAAKLVEEQIAPLNASGDLEGCKWSPEGVKTPQGFKKAYQLFAEGGWVGLCAPAEHGGMGLPFTIAKVVDEILCSGNVAFALYPGLTSGCFEAIHANGSEDQKALWLPRLASGEWTGAMCLTEPAAGSDLAAIKTRAVPQADGSYKLFGNKIFISSGEHDLTDNIVHFVLARIEGAPAGIKGLSTFVVPKVQVNDDGTLGERNGVDCIGIEHKMGIHGSSTCQIQFNGAVGSIVGAPNTGIMNMFVMMNLARILVAMQGLGQCELAFQNAVSYAMERKQGRAIAGSDSDVPIIEHPDVRRMLMTMKAATEGARVLAYETGLYVDLAQKHPDPAVREMAQDWVELNTPLAKSWCTDMGFELASLGVQVFGGHGFVRDHGMEQIIRDAKVFCIYEGTNGIQALDLVRRKLGLHGGRLPRRFFEAVDTALAAGGPDWLVTPMTAAVAALKTTTQWMSEQIKADPNAAAAGATDYQRAFALTYLGYNWLRMVRAAQAGDNAARSEAKTATARFFADRMLSQVEPLCSAARCGSAGLMDVPASALLN